MLYDRRWPAHDRNVEIRIRASAGAVSEAAAGTYLRCARITVDVAESGLHATTLCGARSRAWQTETSDRWDIDVPADLIATTNLEDVEELIILVLTAGWRSAGWVPVHAAAVTDGTRARSSARPPAAARAR